MTTLWADESGDFSDQRAVVVLGGFVSKEVPQRQLKTALRRLFPGWPWPLHAAYMRLPVGAALASATARAIDPTVQTPIDREADAALAAMQKRQPELVARAIDEFSAGRMPEFALLARLNNSLQSAVAKKEVDEEILRRLEAARDEWARAIAELASKLPSAYGVCSTEASLGCAGEFHLKVTGKAGKVDAGRTDRYFGLLGSALALATTIHARREPGVALSARIASVPVLEQQRGLNDDDLRDVLSRYASLGADVTNPKIVSYRDPNLPPLIVVADFVVNAVRRVLVSGMLDPMEPTLTATTGLAFETTTAVGAYSHVVRVGEVRP